MGAHCTQCGICVGKCRFLKNFGNPKVLAASWINGVGDVNPFFCSLCRLCSSVCPQGLDPAEMVLAVRTLYIEEGEGRYSAHGPLRFWEKAGSSSLLSWYGLPTGCRAVYFPGCSLPGTRPKVFQQLFYTLAANIEHLGLVLDCCARPSHDLGDVSAAESQVRDMCSVLRKAGVETIYVSCPGCYSMLSSQAGSLRIRTIYEYLDTCEHLVLPVFEGTATVHDCCVTRDHQELHEAVRSLLSRMGIQCHEMQHTGSHTICCGEGGGVHLLDAELAGAWGQIRQQEFTAISALTVVTYCGGCSEYLGRHMTTCHILDLLFGKVTLLEQRPRVWASPWLYLVRLAVKWSFQHRMHAAHRGCRNRQGKIQLQPPPS